MKKIALFGLGALLLGTMATGCGKSPEAVVNDVYKSASEQKFENIAAYVLPDSVEQFNEAEKKTFAEFAASRFFDNEYSSFSIDSVVVNPEETEAHFVANTNFKNGLSFTETGTLRRNEKGNWRLMVDREVSDTTDVFSVSDKTKATPELMRNLNYATVMTLAGRGLPQYQVMAANIIKDGVLTDFDSERMLALLTSAADKNYVPAYGLLGELYDKGSKKVAADKEKAFEWYTKAAEAGDVTAYNAVAYAYRGGDGVIKDYDKAKQWYEKGIENNDPRCMMGLAYMYSDNIKGFETDYVKFYELNKKGYDAAVKASDKSMIAKIANNIGVCYLSGYGVKKNANTAMEWYTKAAEAGDNTAMMNLANTYYTGSNGISKDYNKAFYWYSKAAKAGDLDGKYNLAECYEYGRGVDMNKKKAKSIYSELWRDHDDQNAYRAFLRID